MADNTSAVRDFTQWLVNAIELLKLQLISAESLKNALINLDIESCVRDLESQQQFLIKTHSWYDVCWKYWENVGYGHPKQGKELVAWLDKQQVQWAAQPEKAALLQAWSAFCKSLADVQELNTLNQTIVQHVSEDTRRKLHMLMEYAGVGNTVYTPGGDTEVKVSDVSTAGHLTGGGRLLAKG